MLVAGCLATLFAVGIGNQTASPTSWVELTASLPPASPATVDQRAVALLRFAHDEDPPLADRLRAARAVRALAKDSADPRRLEAVLLLAELSAVADRASDRRTALWEARALARKRGLANKARHIDDVLAAEQAVAALRKALARKRADRALVAKVASALPAWLALGDERQHGAARVVLAAALLVDGDAAAAERALSDAVDALGRARDHAAVRAAAWRALAQLFESSARWHEAAAAAIAADRAAATDPKRPLTSAAAPNAYVRSRETARLCNVVRAHGQSCATIERARWGDRTFYDFGSERRTQGFDVVRAADVLAEYESELRDCLKEGAKANLTTDSHVELVWTVGNDGRVAAAFDLNPLRLRGTMVETCLREAFARFRYPPYRGELQHVRLAFDVGS